MRIVKRKEFLQQPSGTLYSDYESNGMISGLKIKYDTWTNDWIYQDLINPSLEGTDNSYANTDTFEKAEIDSNYIIRNDYDCNDRDGLFEDNNTMYVIYEKEDIERLIGKLRQL